MELGMNHAGEISTLVAIAEPDVRVWTNVGDAHLGFFASADAIADAKAEILEDARPRTRVLVCNADDARVMARARRFAGRDADVRRRPAARPFAPRDVEDRGLDGMRARVETPAGERIIDDAAARPRQPVERAGGDGRGARVRRAARRDRAAARTLQPADRRGAVRRLRDGVTLIDDSYNSSPAALRRALDVVAREARGRAKRGRARRDARARRPFDRAARGVRPARPRRRACACCSPSAARRRARWPTPRWPRACRASAVSYFETSERGGAGGRRRGRAPATWCWSRDRAASGRTSWPTASWRSSADAVLPAAAARDSRRTSAC